MHITSSDDLRALLDLGRVQAYVEAADQASGQAMVDVEAYLRTPLQSASYSDVFLLDVGDLASYRLKLKLTAGFVDMDSLEIGTGITQADAEADTTLTDYAVVNAVKGSVTLSQQSLSKFISVRYDAGFPAQSEPNDDTLDLSTAPQWLVEAGKLRAIALLGEHPAFKSKDGKTLDTKSYNMQFQSVAQKHIRYLPGHLLPINT